MTIRLGLTFLLSCLVGCATVDPYPRLQQAIRAHHFEEAENLLKAHPQTMSASDALIVAAEAGDIQAVGRFLAQGALLNVRNAEGETALTVAARHGKADMVEYLVERGANPEFKDGAGRNAYDYATTWNPWEFVVTKNKKLIAQYLRAVSENTSASMADFAQDQAQDHSHIWGDVVPPGGPAYVVELQSPIFR
jgi:Ankyrin repeats (3 copies)